MRLQVRPPADRGEEGHALAIDFGAGGNSAEYRRAGWSEPEPGHAWTLGFESRLVLPRPTAPGTYRLALRLGPFVWRERLPAQRLSILVNGRAVGDFSIREVAAIECDVPWSAIVAAGEIELAFRHPDAAVPRQVSGVADDRCIALAFEQLEFYRLEAPFQPVARPMAESPAQSDESELSLDRLMLQFESLGENCEFGLAQRRCGADPLGLLRFASAPLPRLLNALQSRFEGIGNWDQVEVRISGNGREYLVHDRRYGFLYHPWVLTGEASAEEIREREARRLPLLRRKLIEDLEEARKIFVFHGMRPLGEAEARTLARALRAYGQTTLLWVELADDEHPAGAVEARAEGLLKGYIDRFAPGEDAHDLSLAGWIAICRSARAISAAQPDGSRRKPR